MTSAGVERLTERERMVLRLLVQGHDIKSIARALSITTTAANERLRTARQKLGVSSSREAARILAAEEGSPSYSVDMQTGVPIAPDRSHTKRPSLVWIGVLMAGENSAPRVVSTNPASAALIPPGPLKLSVTFDRPM
ncbi:MAG TPA: helix-turn-helix transcriptional regulator, partial [Sphingomicrobium sp.]